MESQSVAGPWMIDRVFPTASVCVNPHRDTQDSFTWTILNGFFASVITLASKLCCNASSYGMEKDTWLICRGRTCEMKPACRSVPSLTFSDLSIVGTASHPVGIIWECDFSVCLVSTMVQKESCVCRPSMFPSYLPVSCLSSPLLLSTRHFSSIPLQGDLASPFPCSSADLSRFRSIPKKSLFNMLSPGILHRPLPSKEGQNRVVVENVLFRISMELMDETCSLGREGWGSHPRGRVFKNQLYHLIKKPKLGGGVVKGNNGPSQPTRVQMTPPLPLSPQGPRGVEEGRRSSDFEPFQDCIRILQIVLKIRWLIAKFQSDPPVKFHRPRRPARPGIMSLYQALSSCAHSRRVGMSGQMEGSGDKGGGSDRGGGRGETSSQVLKKVVSGLQPDSNLLTRQSSRYDGDPRKLYGLPPGGSESESGLCPCSVDEGMRDEMRSCRGCRYAAFSCGRFVGEAQQTSWVQDRPEWKWIRTRNRVGHVMEQELRKDSATGLLEAAKEDNLDDVRLLLRSKADVTACDGVREREAPCLQSFLAVRHDFLSWQYGRTALHFAAWNGNLDMVKVLARSGSPLQSRTIDGKKAIRCAADSSQADVVNFLLTTDLGLKKTDLYFMKLHYNLPERRAKAAEKGEAQRRSTLVLFDKMEEADRQGAVLENTWRAALDLPLTNEDDQRKKAKLSDHSKIANFMHMRANRVETCVCGGEKVGNLTWGSHRQESSSCIGLVDVRKPGYVEP
eukprot:768807-Hanusia_phi.AAC.10